MVIQLLYVSEVHPARTNPPVALPDGSHAVTPRGFFGGYGCPVDSGIDQQMVLDLFSVALENLNYHELS